jgi:diguanylate cyclase (GGDEF)-like protein
MESIQEKFKDIQEHLNSEVNKANEEIKRLKQKVKQLQDESNLDPLTKTLNRRALKKYLSNVCNKQNFKHELHLLIIDLDDFKLINDKYGHIAGDKILIFISNMLKHTLRDGDKIFRYGGEEFIIVLNRINKEQCEIITKRLVDKISSNNLLYKGESIKVTVSIGSTTFKVGDTPESLIHRADEALYEAKRTGKNKHIIKE